MPRQSVAEQPALIDQPPVDTPTTALAAPAADNIVLMFERLAKDPAVDVQKLERLIGMQERILAHNAKAAFNGAFSAMQAEIPEIDEHGVIRNREGEVQSRYAKNEDIQKVLRPILQKHGFSLSFRTEWPEKGMVKVVGILTHDAGHSRESEFIAQADTSGNKNAIQALGSSVSYGHRYTTCDLLNITSRVKEHGADDDGQTSERPQAPEGYEQFQKAMSAAAERGMAILSAGWNEASKDIRHYAQTHDRAWWGELRAKANAVKGSRS